MRWVLLPGFDGTGMLFEPFAGALPKEISLSVLRYPSDRCCSANDLLSIVLAGLPDREPYVLIAESFSGPIALKAASSQTNPPVAVVLCASFANCPVSRIFVKAFRILLTVVPARRPPRWLVRRFLLGKASEELFELFFQAVALGDS